MCNSIFNAVFEELCSTDNRNKRCPIPTRIRRTTPERAPIRGCKGDSRHLHDIVEPDYTYLTEDYLVCSESGSLFEQHYMFSVVVNLDDKYRRPFGYCEIKEGYC